MVKRIRPTRLLPAMLALVLAACGSSGTPSKTDGGSDRAADMESAGGGHAGGAGGTSHPGGGAGGSGALGGGGGHAGQAGGAGQGGAGGLAGQGGAGGLAGQGGAGGRAGQGGAGPHDAGPDTSACANNPDPCACGRPDANSISASECVQEKACQKAGGVWEPYEIFLEGGSHYGPRCQTLDGGPLDAS